MVLKQSTAASLPILLYDKDDLITPETGVVFGGVTCYYSKEGGAEVTKTVDGSNWTEIGHGKYTLDFDTSELDTLGLFSFTITDGRTVFADFSGGVYMIETGTLTDLETKSDQILTDVAENQTDLDLILVDTTALVARLGSGSRAIVFHTDTSAPVNVPGVQVTVYDAADTGYVAGPSTTDVNGLSETFNLDDATYTIRFSKAGAVNESQSKTVSADGQIECEVTVTTASNPSDPDVCRVFAYVTDVSNVNTTGAITAKLSGDSTFPLQKVNGQFLRNTVVDFILDTATEPDRYYVDLVRGAKVTITGTVFGFGNDITVPDQINYDLATPID